MILELATGTGVIPDSMPGEPVVVIVQLSRPMPSTEYDVDILPPASIPPEDLEISARTAAEVTITVTRPQGSTSSPGATIHVICTQKGP